LEARRRAGAAGRRLGDVFRVVDVQRGGR